MPFVTLILCLYKGYLVTILVYSCLPCSSFEWIKFKNASLLFNLQFLKLSLIKSLMCI